jgi:hypothetical protein
MIAPDYTALSAKIIHKTSEKLGKVSPLSKKIGVYSFINSGDEIVYVGVSTSGRNHSLHEWVLQELRKYKGNNSQTLSKNIIYKIPIIFGENFSAQDSITDIQNYRLNVFFTENSPHYSASALAVEVEAAAISIFSPIYNR